jgi:hypothetical protein
MAELTATVLALAGAAATITKVIRSLKNAPQELLALSNEIIDLQVVFDEIGRILVIVRSQYVRISRFHDFSSADTNTSRPSGNHQSIVLSQALIRARKKISALNRLLEQYDLASTSTIHRIKWTIRKREMKTLIFELREVRHDLGTLLAVHNAYAAGSSGYCG